MLKIILLIIAGVVLIIIGLYWYIGGFQKLEVVKKQTGGYVVAGLEYTGAYHKVAPVMMKADSIMRSIGVMSTKGFGIYYDNPKTTPEDKLRSFVGNIIESGDVEKLEQLKQLGLRIDSIPVKQSLVVEMTVRNKLSYMIGPMKAYPLLNERFEKESCKQTLVYELYDVPAKKTLYVMQCE